MKISIFMTLIIMLCLVDVALAVPPRIVKRNPEYEKIKIKRVNPNVVRPRPTIPVTTPDNSKRNHSSADIHGKESRPYIKPAKSTVAPPLVVNSIHEKRLGNEASHSKDVAPHLVMPKPRESTTTAPPHMEQSVPEKTTRNQGHEQVDSADNIPHVAHVERMERPSTGSSHIDNAMSEKTKRSHMNVTYSSNTPINNNSSIVKPKAKPKPKLTSVPPPFPTPPDMSQLDVNDNHIRSNSSLLCPMKWHADYAAMHARAAAILHRVPSEEWDLKLLTEEGLRVFIYIAREGYWEKIKSGGVSDRFSLVGMFTMSLAHNTAFFIDYPGLSDVFDSGSGGLSWKVNATGYIAKHGYQKTVLHFPDLYPPSLKKGERVLTCPQGNNGHRCRDLTLDKRIANQTLTIARTARGKISVMFSPQETYYQNLFKSLELKHETTFGCLFDYLFQPSNLLKKYFAQDMAFFDSSDSIKILLQIRAGDVAITNQHNPNHFRTKTLPLVKHFISCAFAMEDKIKKSMVNSNRTISWYVMADSSAIREYMTNTFGDKVTTHNSTIQNLMTENYSAQSFLEVLGEQWCSGQADYFIVSAHSGLGRQAAFRSKRLRNRVVSIDDKKGYQCTPVSDILQYGLEYSGI